MGMLGPSTSIYAAIKGIGGRGTSGPVFQGVAPDPLTYQMLGVKTGVGDLTEGRTSDLWLPDYQGVYRKFGNGEPGYEGGRYVSGTEVYADDGASLPLAEVPWLVHAPQATNSFWNSTVPVTQNIAGLTGDHVCWLEGTGTVTLSGGATGVASDGVPITFDPAGATVTFTVAGGPPDFVQVEGGTVPTYPIPTEGSAVTRDRCALSFDAANHSDVSGAYYLEVIK